MIMLVLRMLRVRRRRALGVLLIAAFTVAVAAAAPAYLAAADRAVIRAELGQASVDEMSMQATASVDLQHGDNRTFETGEPAKLSAPWLVTTFSVNTDVTVVPPPRSDHTLIFIPQLVYRQDYCAHVVLLSGRCPVAVREVLIDRVLADALHLGPGDTVTLAWSTQNSVNGWSPKGPPMAMSIVGVYRVDNPGDTYWGTAHYFAAVGGERGGAGPVLTDRGTLVVFPHQSNSGSQQSEVDERQEVDAVLRPGALTPELIPAVRDRATHLIPRDSPYPVSSGIVPLLDRIDADRATMRQIVPVVTVPLVILGCVVLFLIVAYAAVDRRPEIAAVRLRGARRLDRWVVVAGESVLPVLAAVPIGLAGGTLLAWLAGRATLTGPVVVPFGALRPELAAATVAAMLVVVLVAYRRVFAEPVSEIVRAVPARASGWRSYTLEALVVTVAVVAVAQMYLQKGPLVGITLGAPALAVTAVALLVGWLVPPVVSRLGARSLSLSERAARRSGRRGSGYGRGRRARLAVGLGAVTLARRPGAQRLLALQAIAIGLVGFVAATAAGAAHARVARVDADLGASEVLSVDVDTPAKLVAAVRAADPSGRYAMAAIPVSPASGPSGAVLAVDSSRLAAVAGWPSNAGMAPAAVAAGLHPAVPPPVRIAATFIEITVDAQILNTSGSSPPAMTGTLAPLDGGLDSIAEFGPLAPGRHTYRAQTRTCADGCRLVGLNVSAPPGSVESATVTVNHLDVAEPTRSRVDLPWTDANAWRAIPDPTVNVPPQLYSGPSGLSENSNIALTQRGMTLGPKDTPYPLPALQAGKSAESKLNGLDGSLLDVRTIGHVDSLPRLGSGGILVDLAYLDQLSIRPVSPSPPAEVWLAAGAPPGIRDALTKAGLTITGSRSKAAEMALLAHQGPAVGYLFGLVAAAAAVLLAAVCVTLLAGIDRRRRIAELTALRVQGLRVATARRATVLAQVGLMVAAGVTGCAGAAVAWLVAGDRLPVFADGAHPTGSAGSGPWWALLGAAGAGVAVLALAAVWVAVDVGRGVAASALSGPGVSAVDGTPRQVARRDEMVGSVR
ncbi:MAG TPA: FtsX-like permease family protein [Micromonosporaceae bacterium]|nr:FtsX-like permease family protein [Micromonosporaceae bacterium]